MDIVKLSLFNIERPIFQGEVQSFDAPAPSVESDNTLQSSAWSMGRLVNRVQVRAVLALKQSA